MRETPITVGTARTTTAQHIALADEVTAHTCRPLPVVTAQAGGAWVNDVEGRRLPDCLAGYSTLNFGHGP